MGTGEGTVKPISMNNEQWSRYFFGQFIRSLKIIHSNDRAHLNIKIDNV